MAGYTRQSTGQIINGSPITAPPLNSEFNQVAAAFNATTGHGHTGGVGDSPQIPLATSVSGYLPSANGGNGGKNNFAATSTPLVSNDNTQGYAPGSMWENTTTGRVYVCVGSATGAAVWRELTTVISNNQITPATHNTVDLGTPSVRFQDLYLQGGISAVGNVSVGGALNSTSLTTTGTITVGSTIDINGGTIDGTVVGGSSAQAVTGTVVTATTNFAGDLMGNVTGNLTGNSAGTHTGAVIGDVTGNITAASGTSSVNNLTVNGTLNMNAGTSATIENLSAPSNANDAARKADVDAVNAAKLNLSGGTMSGDIAMGSNTVSGLGAPSASTDAATKGYVDTSVSNLVDSAPGTLDTLNELAAALGDDPNFSTTLTNSIATKLPLAGGTMTGDIVLGANKATSTATPATDDTLTRKGYVDTQDALKLPKAGGTMSGAIAMGTNKITGLGDPTANQDASTKAYTDTQRDTRLPLAGGSMAGGITMGNNKVTATYTPSANIDLTNKSYVDGILGSATSAATSAASAATSATNAGTSATNSSNSAAAALVSQNAAAASYDSFDDRYLGAKSSAPSVDNDGDALVTGALYWNSSSNGMYAWSGSAWVLTTNYNDAAVDTHLNTGTAASGEFLSWNGSDYDWVQAASDSVGTITGNATLNLSTGNFFAHTPTANTTLAFSNPPASGTPYAMTVKLTNATLYAANDLANASYANKSLSVQSQDNTLRDIAFKSDGTSLYALGAANGAIYQYTLSTAYDISTASYANKSLSISSQENNPMALDFNSDGTKVYVVGLQNKSVYQYSLSTPYDLSTGSYDSVSFSLNSQDSSPRAWKFFDSGTKMIMTGGGSGRLFQYALSTAYDLSTASYNNINYYIGGSISSPRGAAFSNDGTKLFVVDYFSPRDVKQFNLSSAYNISTASYSNISFVVGSQQGQPYGLIFSADGSKMYVSGEGANDTLFQYNTGAALGAATFAYPSSVQWLDGAAPTDPEIGSDLVLSFYTQDGGTTYYGHKLGATPSAANDIFYENSTTVASNYTITSGKNAMTAGPVTIASGVTVTVPSGSRWAVV